MKTKIMLVIIMLALMGTIPILNAQVSWTPYTGNPVITPAMIPKVDMPSVLYDGTMYRMWFSRDELSIGYATSSDGISWTLVDTAVLATSTNASQFDNTEIGQPSVIKDGDTLKMWYWGTGGDKNHIGYAWSLNGISWTKVNGAGSKGSVYDKTIDGGGASGVLLPSVIKDGSVYRMWYALFTTVVPGDFSKLTFRIGYATSSNGIGWTKSPGSGGNGSVLDLGATGQFDAGLVFPATVMKTTTGFEMWYVGSDKDFLSTEGTGRIGYATSPDGVVWTRVSGSGTNGALMNGGSASVIKSGSGYKLWYISATDTVSYATSGATVIQNKLTLIGKKLVCKSISNNLIIELSNYNNSTVEIVNLEGQLIQRIPLRASRTLVSTNNLSTGLYLLKVKSLVSMSVQKFIIQ